MNDDQITALRSAGVWPTGADWLLYNQMHAVAEALLIVEMMERLPEEWIVYRRIVCGAGRMNPDTGKCEPPVRVWRVRDMLASFGRAEGLTFEDADKFQALFSALVAAGLVKETT
jgi:hypothetical protein